MVDTKNLHGGSEKFQIYGKLQSLEDALSSQNIESRYFYLYATAPFPYSSPPPYPFPLWPLQSQATMTLNIRLFSKIWIFFKCDDFTVL